MKRGLSETLEIGSIRELQHAIDVQVGELSPENLSPAIKDGYFYLLRYQVKAGFPVLDKNERDLLLPA
jgi:hypothetical protein